MHKAFLHQYQKKSVLRREDSEKNENKYMFLYIVSLFIYSFFYKLYECCWYLFIN